MAIDEAVARAIFEEEREALDLPSVKMVLLPEISDDYLDNLDFKTRRVVFNNNSTGAYIEKDGGFTVQFNPFAYRNEKKFRSATRHELYHVKRDLNVPKPSESFLRFLFIEEPRAMIYQYFGIQL